MLLLLLLFASARSNDVCVLPVSSDSTRPAWLNLNTAEMGHGACRATGD
jgi:hypothetical protein